jgi:hypothetical protein
MPKYESKYNAYKKYTLREIKTKRIKRYVPTIPTCIGRKSKSNTTNSRSLCNHFTMKRGRMNQK